MFQHCFPFNPKVNDNFLGGISFKFFFLHGGNINFIFMQSYCKGGIVLTLGNKKRQQMKCCTMLAKTLASLIKSCGKKTAGEQKRGRQIERDRERERS